MKTDPGNIFSNALSAAAGICGKVEICWDGGSNWTDESAYVVSRAGAIKGTHYIIDPQEGVGSWGYAPLATCDIVLDNSDNRFSVSKAGSQANTYGIYGRSIRVSLGYLNNGTPQLARVFTGTIVDTPSESARNGEINLSCKDIGAQYINSKRTTVMYTNLTADAWIAILAAQIGCTNYVLEPGMTLIPYVHINNSSVIQEMTRAAGAEGGIVWFDSEGAIRFWNAAHWIGKTSVATYQVAHLYDLQPRQRYQNMARKITVNYQPRIVGNTNTVYSLKEVLIVDPGQTLKHIAEFRSPLHKFGSYTLKANNGCNADMSSSVTVTPATPQGAQRWEISFGNTHSFQAVFINKFDVTGWPLDGRPASTVERDAGSGEDREHKISDNWYIQSKSQAEYLAEMYSYLMRDPANNTRPRPLYTLPNMDGNPLLEPGDIITVVSAEQGINTEMIIAGFEYSFGGGAYDQTLAVMQLPIYPYADSFVVGGSGLNSARILY